LELNSVGIEIKHLTANRDIEDTEYSSEELDFNTLEMENKLDSLKNRLQRFGPVNLLAPEEYLKLEDRNKFLTEQVEDLENAMDSLRKAINKLDKESKMRFKETYDLVMIVLESLLLRLFQSQHKLFL